MSDKIKVRIDAEETVQYSYVVEMTQDEYAEFADDLDECETNHEDMLTRRFGIHALRDDKHIVDDRDFEVTDFSLEKQL